MLVIAAYSVGRLVVAATGSRSERDVDAFHVTMGISMAGMLTGNLSAFSGDVWAVLFACATVWFVLRLPWAVAVRATGLSSAGHQLSHVVSSGAMVYMLLAAPLGAGDGRLVRGMAGMGTSSTSLPFLAALLAVALFAAAAVHARQGFVRQSRRPVPVLWPTRESRTDLDMSPMQARTASTANLLEVKVRKAPPGISAPAPFLAPRAAVACEVAMGLVMAYMLTTMV
jgi:hypothetical protein